MLSSECFFERAYASRLRRAKDEEKRVLLQRLWPKSLIDLQGSDEGSYREYLNFFRSELVQIQHHQADFAAQNLESIFEIILKLRKHHDKPCSEIIQDVRSQFHNFDAAAIQRSLELSVRLWLMINIRSPDILVGPVFAGENLVEWETDTSLIVLIQRYFPKRTLSRTERRFRSIDSAFSAAYLVNTCGMKVQWTDNIVDHLKFDATGPILTVYRHKICLVNHIENKAGCPIPEDLLGEMLDTMNLLFPFGDENTKQHLKREGQMSIYSLGTCSRNRKLDLAQYNYFSELLEVIIDFFEKEPRTWRQLAFDRRNKLEWSAFWVTVMVAVLTIVSIPCNIIQATYSVKAYHVALAQ